MTSLCLCFCYIYLLWRYINQHQFTIDTVTAISIIVTVIFMTFSIIIIIIIIIIFTQNIYFTTSLAGRVFTTTSLHWLKRSNNSKGYDGQIKVLFYTANIYIYIMNYLRPHDVISARILILIKLYRHDCISIVDEYSLKRIDKLNW